MTVRMWLFHSTRDSFVQIRQRWDGDDDQAPLISREISGGNDARYTQPSKQICGVEFETRCSVYATNITQTFPGNFVVLCLRSVAVASEIQFVEKKIFHFSSVLRAFL